METLVKIFDHDKNRIISEAEWMQVMSGFEAHSHPNLMAIRPGATKDARQSHLAWEIQRGIPETPSLLYCRGKLYLLRDGGMLTCLEAATGRSIHRFADCRRRQGCLCLRARRRHGHSDRRRTEDPGEEQFRGEDFRHSRNRRQQNIHAHNQSSVCLRRAMRDEGRETRA
ncbi:MAG: hypothetical protein ACYTGS_08105 [Planctomycetota bacterium]|jgi:hypothetical protein